MNKTSYLNHIQGLRAIAVIFVIFYHLTKNFSFGYVGVDIFFVISGYLITGILVREMEADNFSFLGFGEVLEGIESSRDAGRTNLLLFSSKSGSTETSYDKKPRKLKTKKATPMNMRA